MEKKMSKKEIVERMRSNHNAKGKHVNPAKVENYGFHLLLSILSYIASTFQTIRMPDINSAREASTGKGITFHVNGKAGEILNRIFITNPKHSLSRNAGSFGMGMPEKRKAEETVSLDAFQPLVAQHKGKFHFSNNWNVLYQHIIFSHVPNDQWENTFRHFGMID